MNEEAAAASSSLRTLIDDALEQGIRQVEAAGSPLNPFLMTDSGEAAFLFDPTGEASPIDLALGALRKSPALAGAQRLALVLDTRITTKEGSKSDAILVLACDRGGGEGESWARFYRPKGWFRRFRAEADAQQVGTARNLFEAALEPA